MGTTTSLRRFWLFALLAVGLSAAVLGACSSEVQPADDTKTLVQATVTDPGATTPLTLSFQLHTSVPLTDVVVAARDLAKFADRVNLAKTTDVTQGRIEVGNQAKTGNLAAHTTVKLGHQTVVSGDVRAGGTVTREASTVVTGAVSKNLGPQPTTTVAWTIKVPVANLGNVSLEPDQKRDLLPGRYGNLVVKSRAQLTLHTGVYAFGSIALEPDAKLRIEDREGPVQIVGSGAFTFRGAVVSARQSIPQVLFALQGTQDVFVEKPFTGVLIAPNATVRFQAALPQGHRAIVVGKNVWLEPDTKIRRHPFDWSSLVGAKLDPMPPNVPVHKMPADETELTINIPPVGGTSTTKTASIGTPRKFRLVPKYTVEGGIIGNGTVVFRFNPGSGFVTCTYKGQSPDAAPDTADELIQGTSLVLQGCSDGQPATAERTANQFELTVNPIPNFPVTVQPPLQRPHVCEDIMELLSPAETRSMRQGFNWSSATKVPDNNPDGSPTLYPAWVYIRNKEEALALKKLFIHVLSHPLFDEELMQYAGKCGTFTNPGDGEGTFVSALMPGRTYNRLIDALTSGDVSGDRVIFDAVILRPVPVAARNANGSINLQVLGRAGFRYLDYEANPFAPDNEIVLDGGGSKVWTDALAWVGQAARDAGEIVTGILNEIDQFFRGEVEVTVWVHALTADPLFGSDVLHRAWGVNAGEPIGASGMQVKILQKMFGTPVPTTAKDDTNVHGRAIMDVTQDAAIRGKGLCIELRTRAAIVTDFLIASELCDLRGYDAASGTTNTVEDFRLDRLEADTTLDLHIDNARLAGFYQANDVFAYSEDVMDYEPKRARILSGYWATTFTTDTATGYKRLYAPCLNFPNSFSDAMALAAAGGGAIIGSILPGVGSATGAIALGTFASVVGNSDIVMSTESKVRLSRGVLSHEYGHYMFCNMIYDADGEAVDHVIWGTMIRGDLVNFPLRYTNEAVAEYFEGQVASGADYGWLQQAHASSTAGDQYCSDIQVPCWDANLQGNNSGTQNIGRVATLLMDMFDGQGAERTANVPTNADAWVFDPATSGIAYSTNPSGDGNDDTALERVALPGDAIRAVSGWLAQSMEPFIEYDFGDGHWEAAGHAIDDMKIRGAVNATMLNEGVSWCDRCRVLALHEPGATTTDVRSLWQSCLADTELSAVLGPGPDPANLRLDANTCTACPDGFTSDANGQCVVCPNTVVGNSCEFCVTDLVLDGNTLPFGNHVFDVNQTSPTDNCPNLLVVEVQNADGVFTRGADSFIGHIDTTPMTESNCERPFALTTTFLGSTGTPTNDVQAATGAWGTCTPPVCLTPCVGLPKHAVTPAEAAGHTVFFRTPASPSAFLEIDVGVGVIIE